MKRSIIVLTVLLSLTMLACSAHAWRSIRTGQKNFERAWSSWLYKRPDKAAEEFSKAADAFAAALAEVPPSRTTEFPSNLTMAGISLYFAGRYEQCYSPMEMAARKDRTIWEALLIPAMASARLGDKEATAKYLDAYLQSPSDQFVINSEAVKQQQALKAGSANLDAMADALEAAMLQQILRNVNTVGRRAPLPVNQCNGQFWWRYSRKPCHDERNFS